MPVEKFSISLPEHLATQIDEIAGAEGLTRSAVIRDATIAYVTRRHAAAGQSARLSRLEEALAGFDSVAQSWGEDETGSLGYLRLIRGESDISEPLQNSDE